METLHRIARAILAMYLTAQGVPSDTAESIINNPKE